MTTYPLSALRTVALRTQGLHTANGAESVQGREAICQVVEQTGCIQIDTLHMVARSHYLALWSRLGSYAPADFEALIFGAQRKFFEGWQHAACVIPLSEYRYQMPLQRDLREHPTNWYNRWLNDTVQKDFVPQVLERIRRE